MKISAGVIGVGHMGLNHASCYNTSSSFDLTAFLDPCPESSKKFQNIYPKVIHCESLSELATYCDSVSICSPTPFHTEQALELLDYNCDLLIEKPLSDKIEDHLLIKNKSSKTKNIVQIGFIEQYNPAVRYIIENFKNPEFVSFIRVAPFSKRGSEVSVLHDLCVHDVAILLSLFSNHPIEFESIQDDSITFSKSTDASAVLLKFKGQEKCFLITHRYGSSKVRQISISDNGRSYSFDLITQEGHEVTKSGNKILNIQKKNCLKEEINSFADHCLNRTIPENNIDFSIDVLKFLKMYEGS